MNPLRRLYDWWGRRHWKVIWFEIVPAGQRYHLDPHEREQGIAVIAKDVSGEEVIRPFFVRLATGRGESPIALGVTNGRRFGWSYPTVAEPEDIIRVYLDDDAGLDYQNSAVRIQARRGPAR